MVAAPYVRASLQDLDLLHRDEVFALEVLVGAVDFVRRVLLRLPSLVLGQGLLKHAAGLWPLAPA